MPSDRHSDRAERPGVVTLDQPHSWEMSLPVGWERPK